MSNTGIKVSEELYKYIFDKNIKDILKENKKVSMDFTLRRLLKFKGGK